MILEVANRNIILKNLQIFLKSKNEDNLKIQWPSLIRHDLEEISNLKVMEQILFTKSFFWFVTFRRSWKLKYDWHFIFINISTTINFISGFHSKVLFIIHFD